RSSLTWSASGDGLSPSLSNRARTKLSIGVRTHFLFFTSGTWGRTGDLKAQCCFGSLVSAASIGEWNRPEAAIKRAAHNGAQAKKLTLACTRLIVMPESAMHV